MRLIIKSHFCYLGKIQDQYDEIIFYPDFKSLPQEKFFKDRFKQLQKKYNIKWSKVDRFVPSDHLLGWDAIYEQRKFQTILKFQNRLFKKIPCSIPESFTAFRKKVEPLLPSYFHQAIRPIDEEVNDELDYYFYKKKLASTYFKTRNQMLGRDFSTKFSAFLSCGALDVRYLYNQVKDFEQREGANKSTYWIVFELLWREFFYWHYQKHTRVYFSENGLRGNPDFTDFPIYQVSELKEKTDNKFFISALNELEQTGFQSNRTRQMFASFWLNDLKLNWRSGANFFERYLIDYDVYSNYGNWMYLAGVGVDPRGKRYFNIPKQLKEYDPEGNYIKRWYS